MRQGVATARAARMMRVVPGTRPAGRDGASGATGRIGAGTVTACVRRPACAATVLLVCCGPMIGGCSSSAYDREHAERFRAYGSAAEFAPLANESTALADGAVSLRLPREFRDQVDDVKEATPAFLRDFPGFVAAYRSMRTEGGTQFPVAVVVGVVPAAERRREDVKRTILAQVRADESFQKAAWDEKPRQVQDDAGQPRAWDVLTLDGDQPFELVSAGSPVEKRQAGVTEIWVSAEPRQKACVVLAWRVPKDVAGAVPLATLAPLTARTVAIAE